GITVAETRRRLELIKALANEPELSESARARLEEAAVKGISAAEFAMRLAGYKKKRREKAEVAGPRLALQDLASFSLLDKLVNAGDREVAYAELETALKKDLAWLRRIRKNGLVET
ncbi:MAG TPA: hypothetical protein V6D47_10235, partial [Oscillatoriaceae cyanobacterium]